MVHSHHSVNKYDIEDLLCQSLCQGDKKMKDRPCSQWRRGDRQSPVSALVRTHFHRGIPLSRGWNPATLTEQGTRSSQILLPYVRTGPTDRTTGSNAEEVKASQGCGKSGCQVNR